MSKVVASMRIERGKNLKNLIDADKHNNRKYEKLNTKYCHSDINLELSKENEILIGTKNIVEDLQKKYKELFEESITEYNLSQTRNDRKIMDYFQKVSDDKKRNLYAEVIIQFGDKKFWEDKSLEERKKLYTPFAKEQLKVFSEIYPNFHISSAVIHYDETSPHIQLIGIGTIQKSKGLKIQTSTEFAKTKEDLVQQQEVFKNRCFEKFKEMTNLQVEQKEKKEKVPHLDLKNFKNLKKQEEKYLSEVLEILTKKKNLLGTYSLNQSEIDTLKEFFIERNHFFENAESLKFIEKNLLDSKSKLIDIENIIDIKKSIVEDYFVKEQKLETLENKLFTKNQEFKKVKKDIENARELEREIPRLKKENSKLIEKKENLENEVEKLENTIDKYLEIIENFKTIQDMKIREEELNKKIREREKIIDKYIKNIKEKEDYLKNLKDGIENFRDELFPTIQSSNPWLKKDISSNENLKNLIFCKNIVEFLADDIKKDYPNAIEIARDTTEKEILQLGTKRKGLER